MPKRLTLDQRDHYRNAGWVALARVLPDVALASVRKIANGLAERTLSQDMLSGIHNPFGYHACAAHAWSFLDIAENTTLLDCVEDAIGPDIILWDSELFPDLAKLPSGEACLWPVEPLAGTIAVVSLRDCDLLLIDIAQLTTCHALLRTLGGTRYVVRYMPATSQFQRDPSFAANRRGAEARPLVNYAKRPLWLMRGDDRRDNDFATGFSVPAARWVDLGSLGDGLVGKGEPSQSERHWKEQ